MYVCIYINADLSILQLIHWSLLVEIILLDPCQNLLPVKYMCSICTHGYHIPTCTVSHTYMYVYLLEAPKQQTCMKCSYSASFVIHVFCSGTSNKIVAVYSQDSTHNASLMLSWLCTATTICILHGDYN